MTLNFIGNAVINIGSFGILGAVGAKASEVACPKIEAINPFKIINKIMPACVKNSLKSGLLNQVMATCNLKVVEIFDSYKMGSIIGAPILEEAAFRTGIQQVITLCLSYGMDITYAQAASIFLTNIIFSMAHDIDIDSPSGTELWMKGVAFSLAYSKGGYLAAVAAHMISNIRQNYTFNFPNILSSSSIARAWRSCYHCGKI